MNVFVYGTLLVPKIWNAVTEFPDLVSQTAVLGAYTNFRVRGAEYPGIVETPESDAVVTGRVFFDVPESALRRLDAYEDSFYERRPLTVQLVDGTKVTADGYCVPKEKAPAILGDEIWTLRWFEENALDRFWARSFGR